ncbi:hypothetical protein D5086_000727 [Populus alba]|uniref:Uncharacterized protein n=1 Tax=Populus alba TaxID=43335 RepID=A0ACC4CWN2_POPAL
MLLSLGTNIGINRVRGVGLVYTNVLSEIPPMFSHFVTNFPAFHHVLIIVTFQYLTIPRVFCQSAIYCKPDWFPPEFPLHLCIVRLENEMTLLCQESNMYWMMLSRDTGLENGSGAESEIRRKRNCRSPSTALGVPRASLIEVGMSYYVSISLRKDDDIIGRRRSLHDTDSSDLQLSFRIHRLAHSFLYMVIFKCLVSPGLLKTLPISLASVKERWSFGMVASTL